MDVVDQSSASVDWPESDGLSVAVAAAAVAAESIVPVVVVTPEKNNDSISSSSNTRNNSNTSKKMLPSSYDYYSGRGRGRRGFQPPIKQLPQNKENSALRKNSSVGRFVRRQKHTIRSSELESSASTPASTLPLPAVPAAVVAVEEEELASTESESVGLELSESERVDDEDEDEDEDLVGEDIGGNFGHDDDDDDNDNDDRNQMIMNFVPFGTTTTTTTPLSSDDTTLFGFNDCLVSHPTPVIEEDDDEDDYSEDDDKDTVDKMKKKKEGTATAPFSNIKHFGGVPTIRSVRDPIDPPSHNISTDSLLLPSIQKTLPSYMLSEDDGDNSNTADNAISDRPSSRLQCTRVIAAVPEAAAAALAPPSLDTSADSLYLPSMKRLTSRVYHRPHTNETVVVGGDVDVYDEEQEDCDSKMSENSTKARRVAWIAAQNRSRKLSPSSSRPPKSSSRSGSSSSSKMRNNTKSSSNRHSKSSTAGSMDNDSTKSSNSNAMGHAVSLAFDKMLGFTPANRVKRYHNNMDNEYSSDEESESMILDIRDAFTTAFGCSAPLPFSPASSHHGHRGSNGSVISSDRGSSTRVRRRRNRINDLLTDDDSRATVDSTVVSSSKKLTTRHARSDSDATAASILSGISTFDSTVVSSSKKLTTRHARSGSDATAASILSGISDGVGSIFSFDTTDELADFSKETSTSRKAATTAAPSSLPPLSSNNRSKPNFKVPDFFDSKIIHHSSSWNSISSSGNNQKQPNAFAPVDLLEEGDTMFEEGKDLLKAANTKVDALMEHANTKADKFAKVTNTKVDELIQRVLGSRLNQADLSFGSTPSTLDTSGESTLNMNDVLHTSSETTKDSLNMSVGDASDTTNRLVGTLSESLEVISETEAIHTTATTANTTSEEISAMKTAANLIEGKQSSSPGQKKESKSFGENFTCTTIDTAKAGVKSFSDNFNVDIFDGIFDTAKPFDGMFDIAAEAVISEPAASLSFSTTEVCEKSSEVDVFEDLLVTKVDVTKAEAPRKPLKVRPSSFTRDAGAPDSAVKSLIGMFDSTIRERKSTPNSSPESNRREVFEEKKEEECYERKKETVEDQDRPTAKDEIDVPESQLDHNTSLDVPQTFSETKKASKFGGVRGLISSFTKNKKGNKSIVSKSQSSVNVRTPSSSKSSRGHAHSKKLEPEIVKNELSSYDRTIKSPSLPVAPLSNSQSSVKEITSSVSDSSVDHAPSKNSKKLEPEGIPSNELEQVEVKKEPAALLTPHADADPDLDQIVSDMEIDREDDEKVIASPSISMLIVESSTTDQDGNNRADIPAVPKGFDESFDTPVDIEKVVTRTQSNEASETDMIFDFSDCLAPDEVDLNVDGWVKFDDIKNDSMSQCPSTPVRILSVVPDTPKTSNIGSNRIKKTTSLTNLEEHLEYTEKSPFSAQFDGFDQSGDWESFGFESKGFNTSISPQKVSAFPTF